MTTDELLVIYRAGRVFGGTLDLLDASMSASQKQGLVLEFGVYVGNTIRHLATLTDRYVYGFDSFEGLPEQWNHDNPKGAFDRGGKPPDDLPANVQLVIGWFDNTVGPFLLNAADKVAFAHIDCDLYSSAKTVLDALKRYVVDGTVLNFNEFWEYQGQENGEAKAFAEFLTETGWRTECLGRTTGTYCNAAFVLRM